MRDLLITRGAPGVGKSTWIEQNDLKKFSIEPDNIRLLIQAPIMMEEGNLQISLRNEKKVWSLILQLLEERMKRGEFVIIDGTHSRLEMITRYKQLAKEYRYRVTVLDFSDIPVETVLERNSGRNEYKIVPSPSILNAHSCIRSQELPNWVSAIKPTDYYEYIQYKPLDFSHWKKIHHIGDIHGCHTALMEYIGQGLKADELYIFLGDIVDRGLENYETVQFFIEICELPNVILIQGNHEIHLWNWASGNPIKSKVFSDETQVELEGHFTSYVNEEVEYVAGEKSIPAPNGWVQKIQYFLGNPNIDYVEEPIYEKKMIVKMIVDEKALAEFKKKVRVLYRRFRALSYYLYREKTVVVTHGGLPTVPANFRYMSADQMIRGVGDYEIDIDSLWDSRTPENTYQLHGHRNIYHLPTLASKRSFNLEGAVERGGHLRAVTLSSEGFKVHETKNNIFKQSQIIVTPPLAEDKLTVDLMLDYLSNHKYIKERDVTESISSFNFTRDAFDLAKWDDMTVKARGLFINKKTKEIVNRSYNKFFNIEERKETKLGTLANTIVYPLYAYTKPNGYLGMLGFDSESNELIFSSKSQIFGDFAGWFKDLFYKTFDETQILAITADIVRNQCTYNFEVILPENDSHIIKYHEDQLVLLDIVRRTAKYEKFPYEHVVAAAQALGIPHKKLHRTFHNWIDFYYWYNEQMENNDLEEEGYVFEDSNGFMFKIKLPYYKFWKSMRRLAEMVVGGNQIDYRYLTTPLHLEFLAYLQNHSREALKDKFRTIGIVGLRDEFISQKEE